jgi:four helix bundle protein
LPQEEARESVCWLKLLAELEIIPSQRLRPLMEETEELFAVITGIILSAKSKTRGEEKER